KIGENDLFIPICGKKVDGHCYIEAVAKKGCNVTLTEKQEESYPENMSVIYVNSCLEAMKSIARFNRERYTIPVIAVTGSSGKTTTKDLIASVLSQKYKTMKTQGNYNNEYGIPQTLFRLEPEDDIAVIEMGMDHLGDIRKSIDEVKPHIGVITNIGTAHIEILKTQDNILAAKKEMFETMGREDIALLNGDDPFLNKIDSQKVPYRVVQLGILSENLDLRAEKVKSNELGVFFEVCGVPYHFAYPGMHNIYNCLSAIWLGLYYKMTPKEIQRGLDAFKPSDNRMEILEMGAFKIINDSYNANPDSMKAALNMLDDIGQGYKRKIAVLGDMLEMGTVAKKSHLIIGAYTGLKADILIGVGDMAKYYLEGSGNRVQKYLMPDAESAEKCIHALLEPGDIILIKGSRGIHLERVVESIKKIDIDKEI
ncbi:MAG: UDP-N-acetylmuramoyl-tripeptide--D-alanyl-D-alanine ligase, partial [Eubacterium sp.]